MWYKSRMNSHHNTVVTADNVDRVDDEILLISEYAKLLDPEVDDEEIILEMLLSRLKSLQSSSLKALSKEVGPKGLFSVLN